MGISQTDWHQNCTKTYTGVSQMNRAKRFHTISFDSHSKPTPCSDCLHFKWHPRKKRCLNWNAIVCPICKDKIPMTQEASDYNFYCERFHCMLLLDRCVQRQKSDNPEIYEACFRCKQGLETVRKSEVKENPQERRFITATVAGNIVPFSRIRRRRRGSPLKKRLQ